MTPRASRTTRSSGAGSTARGRRPTTSPPGSAGTTARSGRRTSSTRGGRSSTRRCRTASFSPWGKATGAAAPCAPTLKARRRLRDLESAPRSEWSRASDALGRIFSSAVDLPVWQGELYLELHRGTYTTQARTKRFNRTLEFALRECELLCAGLRLLGEKPARRANSEKSARSWRKAGSACSRTSSTTSFPAPPSPGSTATLKNPTSRCGRSRIGSFARAAGRWPRSSARRPVAWPHSTPCRGPAPGRAEVPWSADLAQPSELFSEEGSFPVQAGRTLGEEPLAMAALRSPSMGVAFYRKRAAKGAAASAFTVRGREIETPFYRIRLR